MSQPNVRVLYPRRCWQLPCDLFSLIFSETQKNRTLLNLVLFITTANRRGLGGGKWGDEWKKGMVWGRSRAGDLDGKVEAEG